MSRRMFAAITCAAALLPVIGGRPVAASDDPAAAFIQDLGNRAIGVLEDKANSSFAEREAAFRDIMVAGFDIPLVARFVLGRHWKAASEQQRTAYSAVFVDFIVRVYASRFDSYGGEQFVAGKVIQDESSDEIVRGRIVRPAGADPIKVDFRVRSTNGSYKVIDVNVEGISMLHTHRIEFASVVNRKGLDGLLNDLQARVEAPVEATTD